MESSPQPKTKEIHLRDYLKVVLRKKWVVIAFFVVVVVTVTVNTFSMQPVYRATCQVLIERQAPKVVNIQEVITTNALWGFDYYKTQYEILRSKLLAQRAIKELKLTNSSPAPPRQSFNLKRMLSTFVGGIKNLFSHSEATSNDTHPQVSDQESQFINAYLGSLSIEPIKDSRLVNISFTSQDPVFAAKAANTHAKLYIEYSWDMKFATSQDAVRWLNDQIKDVKKKLESSEEELQRYVRENDLASIDFGQTSNIIAQKLSDLNSTLTQAHTARIEKENLYNELKRFSKSPELVESLPAVVNNSLIQQLKGQYFELTAQYSELSQKYGVQHPQMLRLQSQIKEIKNKISQEVRNAARSIETEYRVALAKEQSLRRALEAQKKEALGLNKKEIGYSVLKREVESSRSLYESVLKRLKEASLTEELKVTNISIVDPARVPESPIAPNKPKSLMMAIAVGLIGGIGLAFFFEYLDHTVKSSDEIEAQVGLPFLGYVEHMNSVPNKGLTDQFRTIATNILFSIPDHPQKTILVTSAAAEEGKSLLAVNLAIILARIGKRILLIDADMRNPKIHSMLKLKRSPGLSDILAGQTQLSSALQYANIQGLYAIPAGTRTPNPVELLISQRMATFVQFMREKFDFIIIDTTPVMMLSDPLVLAPLVDGVVVVVRSGVTPRPAIKKAVEQLQRINAMIVGAVLNDHDIKREGYYSYHYYRKYYHRYYGHDEKAPQVRSRA